MRAATLELSDDELAWLEEPAQPYCPDNEGQAAPTFVLTGERRGYGTAKFTTRKPFDFSATDWDTL